MQKNYYEQVKKRINKMKSAEIFSVTDFSDIAPEERLRVYMFRLIDEGLIGRIINGLFFKLEKMDFIDDYIYPSISDIAQAIAKKFVWNIYPDGITSLNILGLSTQVPAQFIFISDGPYREFKIFNSSVKFKHTANKEISKTSYKSSLVIQALKSLGNNNVTKEQKDIIRTKLSDHDMKILLKESATVFEWIRNIIKEICGEKYE